MGHRYASDAGRKRIDDDATAGSHAYAILSICRGLYTIKHGRRLSKREAAAWAQREFPRWANLIRQAVEWRDHQRDAESQDGRSSVGKTHAFVAEMTKFNLT